MVHYSETELRTIFQNPHLLGHLAGKTKLTSLHSDWMKYLWNGKEHRSLRAHRGSYKTTAITELGPILWLARYPDCRIAIVKKTYTSASESVRNIANIMMTSDVRDFLEDMWGPWKFTTLKDGKATVSAKKTKTKEGSLTALGTDSSFTGSHFDVVIFDDIIDLDDRLSRSERDHTKIVVGEFMANIVDPGGFVICTGTPWHPDDAWRVMPPPLDYPVSATHLLTEDEILDKKKFVTPVMWQVNYELSFISEQDMLFTNPCLGRWHYDEVSDVKAHLDAAYDGNHYCALTIMGRLPDRRFNAAGWVFPGNVKEWLPTIVQKMMQYKCSTLYTETNADRGYTADALRKFPAVQDSGIWIRDYDERMKKHQKIATFGYELWKHTEWDEAGSDRDYLEQATTYMEDNEPDDAIDSFASLAREGKYSVTKSWGGNIWNF